MKCQPNRISKRRIWEASIGLFFDFFWILKSWRTNEFPVCKVHSFFWSEFWRVFQILAESYASGIVLFNFGDAFEQANPDAKY